MIRAALLALVTAGASAPTDPFAGRVAGAPVDCIHLSPVGDGGLVIADAGTITYRDGARSWRTGPVGHCTALRPFDTIVLETHGGQVCRDDRFRVLEPGRSLPSAYCRFDRFTPYTAAR